MTTWTMDHGLCDSFIEEGLSDRIRYLSADYIIDVFWFTDLVLLVQEEEEVQVRQTSLLKLNGVDHASNLPKGALPDVLEKDLHLLDKDVCDDVRCV